MHRARWLIALGALALLPACSSSGISPSKTSTVPTTVQSSSTTSPSTTVPASTTSTTVPPVPQASWDTYGDDLTRTNVTASKVDLNSIKKRWVSPELDGQIYAQPLVTDGLVIIATENDTLYGLDASNGKVVWSTHVGTPVPGSALPCGNIDPLGITSTPAIDPASGRLFALAEVDLDGTVGHRLVALDVRDGKVLFEESADPAGMAPTDQQQRPALGVSQGRVYIAYGGLFGDCGTYRGWVVALPTAGPGPMLSYAVPTANQGAIWAPAGPAINQQGDVWVATGNGSSTTTYDEGDSVLELSPSLSLLQSFAPSAWAYFNGHDLDLGSTAPQLLHDGLVFEVGKESTAYLLRAAHLGGIGGQVYQANLCFVIGANAYQAPNIYVPCHTGLEDVVVTSGSSPSFRVAWTAPATANGPPIIAGGYLWSVGQSAEELYGLDPANGRIVQAVPLGASVDNFATPAVGEGLLILGTGNTVRAFGGS